MNVIKLLGCLRLNEDRPENRGRETINVNQLRAVGRNKRLPTSSVGGETEPTMSRWPLQLLPEGMTTDVHATASCSCVSLPDCCLGHFTGNTHLFPFGCTLIPELSPPRLFLPLSLSVANGRYFKASCIPNSFIKEPHHPGTGNTFIFSMRPCCL